MSSAKLLPRSLQANTFEIATGNHAGREAGRRMEGVSEVDLNALEAKHSDGIPSQAIVTFLEDRGVKFSEATLRKYVQLGLLSHSVRVGRKGKHKGSQGMYPGSTVRQILEIKRLLSENKTIDEIRQEYLLLKGEIEELEQQLAQLFEGIDEALKGRQTDETSAEYVRRDLTEARATGTDLIEKLRALESSSSRRVRLARAAG